MNEPGVRYIETEAKSILRRAGAADPWFLGRFGVNLYRGCEHGCVYCDGRAERYYVTGSFDREIQVKRNAVELLCGELARRREPGFVFIGGGVSDAYQPAERRYNLARSALVHCRDHGIPVHVLTKSALVERDLDLLASIDAESRAILSFSIASTDEAHRELFEPGAAPLAKRWELLSRAKELGLGAGVMAMPLFPGLSDQPEAVFALVAHARSAGADFVCFGAMTCRPGAQKDAVLSLIREEHPDLLGGYRRLYVSARPSGAPDPIYLARVDARARAALAEHGMPGRPPWRLWQGLMPTYSEVSLLLEHRGYDAGETPGRGPLGRACWALGAWARGRLARHRRPGAHAVVEQELDWLVRTRTLSEIPGLSSSIVSDVEDLHARVIAARAARPPSPRGVRRERRTR